jgi:hypothetical protein
MCMIDGAETVDCLVTTYRKARKTHRCSECGRTIAPAERYRADFTVFDGEPHLYKCCAQCEAVRQWLNEECGGYVFGSVLEDMEDHLLEYVETLAWALKYKDPSLPATSAKVRFLGHIVVGMKKGWRRRDGTAIAFREEADVRQPR